MLNNSPSSSPEEKPRLTETEIFVAFAELTALGYLEYANDDEVTLSDQGVTYALEVEQKLTPRERVALQILQEICHQLMDEKSV